MKVVVLGCGGSSGVPMVGGQDGGGDWGECDPKEPRNVRTRSSVLLQMDNGEAVLIDTGPDLRAQLLAQRISRFQSIIYTHGHSDHVDGVNEVRAVNRVIGQPVQAYGTAGVLAEIEQRFSFVFKPWTPPGFFRAVLEANPIEIGQEITIGSYAFTFIDQHHGYAGSMGVRCGDFAYSTDVVELPEQSLRALEGVDTWVVDCFQLTPHVAHAWLDRVLEWRERIRPRRTILTHMGAAMDWSMLCATLPDGVEPAYDGLSFHLPDPPRGRLASP
ncbi:MAG: MBL fold metallo-hydrolase [Acetobacter sp.]|uniref:MBL fold metallo-hydrolase n=1 Tax=Acetobacter sp. TaxID=440 RepID=UPI003D00BAA7